MQWNEYLDWIVEPAKEACVKYDLPWQVVVSQGAIESQWGTYGIGNGGFNIFGRKWGGTGDYVEKETQECYDGSWETITAKFQSYGSLQEAIADWCELMEWVKDDGTPGPYKQFADQYHQDHDIEAFARGIAGVYATDPEYGNKIMQTMKACELI
jgi:flagellum-specific peptidoglycan hydrolase FlgJ